MRVLIAEDESLIRLDLRQLLERAGLEVGAEAHDGEEAVELAREHEPDLAVLDVKMPRLDGIEAERRMTAERPIPIVIVSAYSELTLVHRAAEAGVYGYLATPFREDRPPDARDRGRDRGDAELSALQRWPDVPAALRPTRCADRAGIRG